MYDRRFHSEDLSKYSFLVTGGAGFIGSNIVEYLLKYNAGKVIVLDNLANGFEKNIEPFHKSNTFEFIKGDIRDLDSCQKATKNIDFIFHQAALGSVPRSIKDPIASNAVNIEGFLNILVAARDSKVKRVVYAASSSTYGDSKSLPKVEDVIGRPLSPYAVTKYVNELYADVFEKTFKLDCVGLRYFNVYGPKQDPKGAYAAVIPLFIHSLLEGVDVSINGKGDQTRDFTFVENAVEANIRAAFANDIPQESKIFNIACGENISIMELYNILRGLTASSAGFQLKTEREGDVKDSLANIDRAKKYLGYDPQIKIKEGLEITVEWFKQSRDFIEQRN